jgi:N-acetyl-anhydromuramyl-L-alanine amidase AmpD
MPSEWASPRIPSPRVGDEIVVAGEFLHTDAPNRVVCWFDPGGFDAYRTTPALPVDTAPGATPKQVAELGGAKGEVARFGSRRLKPSPAADGVGSPPRGGAGALVTDAFDLTECVTQLVVHHDGCGRSRECFRVLHDERGLSCHFLVDVDGRVFQTLDVAERAWHATDANDVSIGVELASLGAFREPQDLETTPFDVSDTDNVKEHRDFKRGIVNGRLLVQLNFTDKQYDALARLYATLLRRFPKLKLAYPIEESSADDGKKAFATALGGDVGVSRDAYPDVDTDKLTDARRRDFAGALGHFHVQSNKVDPGPAFDWKRLIAETRAALAANGAGAS